jgi:tryptophan 2,3-dioxygenase
MKKDNKRRLVGALGGAGGTLVLYTMLSIVIFPDLWSYEELEHSFVL